MKNRFLSTLLVASLVFSGMGYSKNAHPIVSGVVLMNPIIAFVGVGIAGAGLIGVSSTEGGCFLARLLGKKDCSEKFKNIGRGTFIAMMFVGVMLEDKQSHQLMLFKPLNLKDSKLRAALNLSDSEMRTFNAEVPKLNAINEVLARELILENSLNKVSRKNEGLVSQKLEALWSRYEGRISPESKKVIRAITSELKPEN